MSLQELRDMANGNIRVELSAADLLQVIETAIATFIAARPKDEMVDTKTACKLYHVSDERTIIKRIKDGNYKGEKIGGQWYVETPAMRAERLSNGKA